MFSFSFRNKLKSVAACCFSKMWRNCFNLLCDWLSWASKTAPRKWKKQQKNWEMQKIHQNWANYFLVCPWRKLYDHIIRKLSIQKVVLIYVSSNQEVNTLHILKERKIIITNIHGRVRILSNWTVCMYWHPHY